MKNTPSVTVLMPVYNSEKFLKEAIESILGQTYVDFEFLIINDGSTDRSEEIIDSYKDNRIVYLKNEKNQGLIATLSIGLNAAKAEYIARMDADDISTLDRLEKQMSVIEKDPDLVVLGTGMVTIDTEGRQLSRIHVLEDDQAIKRYMAVMCPFVGPSVVFSRREALDVGGYNKQAYVAEDYDLWSKLAIRGKVKNIDESLLFYRLNPGGESLTKRSTQIMNSKIIKDKVWSEYGSRGPASIEDWKYIWPDKASVQRGEMRTYYSNLHAQFAEEYAGRGQKKTSFQHILAGVGWSPGNALIYFELCMLPFPAKWTASAKQLIRNIILK